MAKDNNLTDFLTDVADAIRAKKGMSDLINPQEFSAKIREIAGLSVKESDNYTSLTSYLANIADTLREVDGVFDPINPLDFSKKIQVININKYTPLYVEAIEDLTISFSTNEIEYSLDGEV